MQDHHCRRRPIAGFHVVPHDGFTVSGRCDEAMYYRRITAPFVFAVSVCSRRARFRELSEKSLDTLKKILRIAAGEGGANTLRRLGVSEFDIHRHLNNSSPKAINRRIHARQSFIEEIITYDVNFSQQFLTKSSKLTVSVSVAG